jgi:hypothetical protein
MLFLNLQHVRINDKLYASNNYLSAHFISTIRYADDNLQLIKSLKHSDLETVLCCVMCSHFAAVLDKKRLIDSLADHLQIFVCNKGDCSLLLCVELVVDRKFSP